MNTRLASVQNGLWHVAVFLEAHDFFLY